MARISWIPFEKHIALVLNANKNINNSKNSKQNNTNNINNNSNNNSNNNRIDQLIDEYAYNTDNMQLLQTTTDNYSQTMIGAN